jgi:hypothetical protein
MEAIRENVHLRDNRLTLILPASYSGKDVEVIVLPSSTRRKHVATSTKKRFGDLFANPLHVERLEPFDREALHDRQGLR